MQAGWPVFVFLDIFTPRSYLAHESWVKHFKSLTQSPKDILTIQKTLVFFNGSIAFIESKVYQSQTVASECLRDAAEDDTLPESIHHLSQKDN